MIRTRSFAKFTLWEARIITILKILLAAASLFILWSILALVSSIYHPLAGLSNAANEPSTSKTLADSLVKEIIGSYFSIFTIFSFGIILANGYLGYRWAKRVSFKLHPLSSHQSPLRVVFNRIFSIENKQIIRLNRKEAHQFNINQQSLKGPAIIQMEDSMALIISDKNHGYRVFSPCKDNQFTISADARVVKFIDLKPKSLIVDLKTIAISKLPSKMRLDYRLSIPRLEDQTTFPNLIRFFILENEKTWGLVEALIRTELDIFLKSKSNAQAERQEKTKHDENKKDKNSLHHSYAYPSLLISRPMRSHAFLHRRKRLAFILRSSIAKNQKKNHPHEQTDEKLDRWMDQWLIQLSISFIQFFGYNPVEILSCQFGERK